MKLLFVHQHLGSFGGAEANILLTASELRARGHTVALLHGEGTGRGEEAWRQTFSECWPVLQLPDPAQALRAVSRFAPQLIYVHKIAALPLLAALLDRDIPVVRMVHDHEMYCLRGYKYNPLTRTTCTRRAGAHCVFPCLAVLARSRQGPLPFKWASYRAKQQEIALNRRCHGLIVYSQYSKAELLRNGFEPQKIDIHVPLRCWGNQGPVSSFSDRNLILFVGQIIRGKGVDVLLRALAKVQLPFECLVLGEGNQRTYCERLCAKLGLDSRVHFHGFVPADELKAFYLECSVFVVSSVWPEPFGLVGPEAMRYGLPVVAFDSGGISEWLTDGQNGYLVPWMDVDRFANRIDKLLANKELARAMGRRGLERVNRDYPASGQVARLESVFQRVLRDAASKTAREDLCTANVGQLSCNRESGRSQTPAGLPSLPQAQEIPLANL